MNNLIDHGLNYVRFALLGIATAFLIIPFNVHAGGGVEQYNLPDLPILSFQSVYLSLGNDGDPAPINYTDVGVFKDNGRYENTQVVEMNGRGNRRGGDNPDADGDGIRDDDRHDSDVCVDEPYQRRYHADCLTEAGLELPSVTCAESDAWVELKEKYQIDLTTLDGRLFAIETLTFQQAAIKTCRDLKTHERDMRKMRNDYRWAAIRTSLVGVVL
ncbi:MAG: hypothetical protein F4166_04555 [Gammaproteobacteria bacterium]|nr:hypothetical protein [Gammaproteobacteria bacterium]